MNGCIEIACRCPNAKFGCKDEFALTELELHESVCPQEPFRCPFCMLWLGPADDFSNHVCSRYTKKDSEKFWFLLRHYNGEIIRSNGELYFMLTYCNLETGYLWINLKYPGPYSHAKRRYFSVELKGKNTVVYRAQRQVVAANNWKIDENNAMKVDLRRLGLEVPIIGKQYLKVEFKVKIRTPCIPEHAIKTLLRDGLCIACGMFMDGPILMTPTGSGVCNNCKDDTNTTKIRNFAMESICKILSNYTNKDHKVAEEELLTQVDCPVCYDYASSPIRICKNGHSTCSVCRPKLTECAVCRQSFSRMRNLNLESICSKINYKCMYAERGCTAVSLAGDLSKHEDSCDFRLPACPFKSTYQCDWRGQYEEIKSHVSMAHKN